MKGKYISKTLALLLCVSLGTSNLSSVNVYAQSQSEEISQTKSEYIDNIEYAEDKEPEISEKANPANSTTELTTDCILDTNVSEESISATESIESESIDLETSDSEIEITESITTESSYPESVINAETELESENITEFPTKVEDATNYIIDIDSQISELSKEAQEAFQTILSEKILMALLYKTDSYSVKRHADHNSDTVTDINTGHTLYITDVSILENNIWYKVNFALAGTEYSGYIEDSYLAYSDEDWLNWKNKYLPPINELLSPYNTNPIIDNGSSSSDIDAFPSSYRNELKKLKETHPNWTFVPMNTGLDFNTVVSNEMGEKSLIQNTSSNSSKKWVGKLYGSGWYYATQSAVEYHINPLNFLTESGIFQFEQLTYNSSYHTEDAIQGFLNNTFMKGKIPNDENDRSYANAFFTIGKDKKLSPIHLASRVYQEQGKGTSPLISGTYSGYEGYYNYFNVGASGKDNNEVIKNGLERAKKEGWNTRYKSLDGGASTIGKNYILKGQDTIYLEKFNVDGNYNKLYTHQYMQNIQAPSSESATTKKMYANAGNLSSAFVFKIPVYKNMPGESDETIDKPITNVTITNLSDSTAINQANVIAGQKIYLAANYLPIDTTSDTTATWISSAPNVASIINGEVTALSKGSTKISVTISGITAEYTVNVTNCKVTFMSEDNSTELSSLEIEYGKTISSNYFPVMSYTANRIFIGWYSEPDGKGTKYTTNTPIFNETVTLHPFFQELGKGFYILPVGDQTYTGTAIKPEIKVYNSVPSSDSGSELIELVLNQDYTITYKNNTKVNTTSSARPTIVVRGKGNYSGSQNVYFNILPKSLNSTDISSSDITLAFNNKVQKSKPTIYNQNKKLVEKTDYTLIYPNNISGAYKTAGKYPIQIIGKGNYKDNITVYETITEKILINKVTITKIPNQTYKNSLVNKSTGKGIEPENLKVTYNGKLLEKNKDYTIKYSNNMAIGTATATITAIDSSDYTGSKSITYKIIGTPINRAKVEGIEPRIYSNAEADLYQNNISVTYNGIPLKASTDNGITGDYKITYSNLSKAGNGTVTITGINEYYGSIKKNFKITSYDISNGNNNPSADIKLAYCTQDKPSDIKNVTSLSQVISPYMKNKTQPVIKLYYKNNELISGKDYTVSYSNNTTVTTASLSEKKLPKITITGKGNFKGKISSNWTITNGNFSDINKVSLTAKDIVYQNKPNKYKTTITVTDANGMKLVSGRDYDKNVIYTYTNETIVSDSNSQLISRKAGEEVDKNDIIPVNTYITVTLTGTGLYSDATGTEVKRSTTYRIVNADISKARLAVQNKTFLNGKPVTLSADDINLSINGSPLKYGIDYIIDENTYTNNVKKGKASVIIRGISPNYGGERKIDYNIVSKSLFF